MQVQLFIMVLYLKGLQTATYRSTAITPNSANSVVPRARYMKSWATHAARDIVCIPGSSNPQSIAGTMRDVIMISKAER